MKPSLRLRIFGVRIKDFMPKSLYGRAMLIIVAPIAIMQVAVAWAFFDAHWETVTSRLSESVAGDIAVVLDLYEQDPQPERLRQVNALASRTMSLSLELEETDEGLPTTVRSSFFRVLDRTLRRAMMQKVSHPFWFDTTRYPAYVDIRIQVEAGILRIIVPRDRVFAATGHIFLLWIVGASTLLTAVSLVYIRNQAKPIERLAEAAERFGRGQDAPNFRPSGASEVRQAARAFLDMRRRIKRHIDQRTTLLAGVSHDLRTPLTRLKLQLAMSTQTDDVKEMRRDLADMEAVLEEYLAFSRGMGGEDPEPTDLGDLAREVAVQAGCTEDNIMVAEGEDLVVAVRAAAMKRCLQNLIGNAAYHGDRVTVSARRANGSIEIDIEDDGPGIDAEQREEVFRPFTQLNAGRSGGSVGLGLTIARDVARGHGGDVRLSESDLGGLRATVRVPV